MNLGQVVRFGLVGLMQNAVNVGTFAAVDHAGVNYRASAVVAALVALVVSFWLNRHWTFGHETEAPMMGHAARYVFVFGAAVAVGIGLLTLFVERFSLAPLAGQVLAILIVAPISYLVQRSWVFPA